MAAASSQGSWLPSAAPGLMRTPPGTRTASAPRAFKMRRLLSASEVRGTRCSTTGPLHKRLAAKRGSTLFLAAGSFTCPSSVLPPCTI